jgi:hypothetical protein
VLKRIGEMQWQRQCLYRKVAKQQNARKPASCSSVSWTAFLAEERSQSSKSDRYRQQLEAAQVARGLKNCLGIWGTRSFARRYNLAYGRMPSATELKRVKEIGVKAFFTNIGGISSAASDAASDEFSDEL